MAKTRTSPRTRKKTARKRGRPTKYDPAKVEEVLAQLCEGQTLSAICRKPGMPHLNTMLGWVREDRDGLSVRYARARALGCELIADAIIDLADDIPLMVMGSDGKMMPNHAGIAQVRVQIDARKWMLAKMMPEKYGNRVQVESEQAIGPQHITILYQDSPVAEPIDALERDKGR